MNNLEENNSRNIIGDPEISELEFYSTMPEDDNKSKVDDTSKEAPTQDATEESEAKPAEETSDEVKSEEEVEVAVDAKSEESPVEDTTEESEAKSEEETVETPTVKIEMNPEEAAKMAMQNNIVKATYNDIRNDLPEFRSGDTISVGYRVIEGSRSRIQSFDGIVIKISAGHGLDKTFTVRKISGGIGVERIFPFHSPNIESIKVLKEGKVRRAKLYYLRSRKGKATRIREKTQ